MLSVHVYYDATTMNVLLCGMVTIEVSKLDTM